MTTIATARTLTIIPVEVLPEDESRARDLYVTIRAGMPKLLVFIELLLVRGGGLGSYLRLEAMRNHPNGAESASAIASDSISHVVGNASSLWSRRDELVIDGEILVNIAGSLSLLINLANSLVRTEKSFASQTPDNTLGNALLQLQVLRAKKRSPLS